MRKLLLLTVCATFFAIGCSQMAHTQTNSVDAGGELADLRVALDQVAQGRSGSARLLLETRAARGPLQPETALVLAHLQERAGDPGRATQTLERSAISTRMARTFEQRIASRTGISAPTRPPVSLPAPPSNSNSRATLEGSDARIARLERQLFDLVNAERRQAGLSALEWNDELAAVARAHSAEMRDRGYFGHDSPTPGLKEPLDRFREGVGTTPRLVAENVYRAWGDRSFLSEADIREANRALMNSPGHRSNILLEGATRGGVGIVSNASGDIWITQMFARF